MENKNNWGNNQPSITETIFEYLTYWKWFIASVFICLFLGVAAILILSKQYRISTAVLLTEDHGGNKPGGELDLNILGLSTTNNIDNEIAIFSSPDLMQYVVDTLNLQVSYFIKEKLRKIEIFDKVPFSITYSDRRDEENSKLSRIRFTIEKDKDKFKFEGIYEQIKDIEFDISHEATSLPTTINLPDNEGQIYIVPTGLIIDEEEKYYIEIIPQLSAVTNLCQSLSVYPTTKTSSVLNIDIVSKNAKKGVVILNELVKQYNNLNNAVNNQMAHNTAIFINKRLQQISTELGDAESDVVEFKQKNRITDLSTEAQLFVEQSGVNETRLRNNEAHMNIVSSVLDFIKDPKNEYALIPNLDITDPALAQTITDYNNLILKNDQLLKNTGEENPSRIKLVESLENTRIGIVNSIENVKKAYTINRNQLLDQSQSVQSRVQSVPYQEKGLLEKGRQQRIKENLFLLLMQKREETDLTIASTADKARMVVSPQSKVPPVAPKSKLILLATLIMGVLIPVFLIYLKKILKTQIDGRSELEKLSEVNVIGQINKNTTRNTVVIHKDDTSPISELFRSLRNNLSFIFKNESNKVMMVTSTIAGEGKTFISINLALSYTLSNKKVLLIGADIRNPQLKKQLNLENRRGLTDYIISEDTDWQNYITRSKETANLDIIISGTIPPNPNELLMNPRLKQFINEARSKYDLIILDTAPVGLVSDSFIIGELVDMTLYVVRENVTPKTAITFINTQKAEGKLKDIYLVLNDASPNKNYQYGYGKAYGYNKS